MVKIDLNDAKKALYLWAWISDALLVISLGLSITFMLKENYIYGNFFFSILLFSFSIKMILFVYFILKKEFLNFQINTGEES